MSIQESRVGINSSIRLETISRGCILRMARKAFNVEEVEITPKNANSTYGHDHERTSNDPAEWLELEDKLDKNLALQAALSRHKNGSEALFDLDDHLQEDINLICAKSIQPWKYSRYGEEFKNLCNNYRSYVMEEPETYWRNEQFIKLFETFTDHLRPDRVFYYLSNLRYRYIKLKEKMDKNERMSSIERALEEAQQYLSRNRYPRYLSSMEYICGDLVLEKGWLRRVGPVSTYSVALTKENIEEAQKHFEKSLALMDIARQELFSRGEFMYLWDMKRTVIAHQERANSALRLAPFLLMTKKPADAWDWVQKAKARGMADMLGARTTLPKSWESNLESEDPEGYELLMEEQRLVSVGTNPDSALRTNTVWTYEERYQQLLHKMRNRPSLSRLMGIRGEVPMAHPELEGLLTRSALGSGKQVVYAEWSIFGREVYLFVARRRHAIQVFLLCREDGRLDQWIGENLNSKTLSRVDVGSNALQKVSYLVTPLTYVSKPEDMIILCPTGLLHRIPLHALEVEGAPLIERNPVVYTHAASILRRCMRQKKFSDSRGEKGMNVRVVADLSGDRKDASRSAIDVGDMLRAQEKLIGKHPGRGLNEVQAVMQNADILYYHGHASFDASETRNLGLGLGSGITMSVKDILALNLRSGAHVTLIACGSYAQNWSSRDEGLGIVPAFLYAGASSAVATFWPAWSSIGALFADCFYSPLITLLNNEDPGSQEWNMALAFQRAVLQVRKEKPAPYFWAPFAFTGYWMFYWTREQQ